MRILFYSYPWAFQKIGGGETQLLKTREFLEKKGIEIRLFNQWEDKLSDYDILHIFGSVKDCVGLIEVAKENKLKICVSSIFWTDIRRCFGEIGIKNKTNAFLRHCTKKVLPFFPSGRRKIFELADLILPNSESEANQIKKYFFIDKSKFVVIPNGVDERFKDATPEEFIKKYQLKNFVLYVGRIEPRKNQLNFIRAMKGFSAAPIVFVGDYTLEHKYYYDICLREKTDNMFFLGHIAGDSALFSSMYAACKVFCLTSWFETPGLAALEAAASGKNIVITPYGSTKDYFGNYAFYARPHKLKEIREKVEIGLNSSPKEDFKQHVLDNFRWEKVAEATFMAYENLLRH
ncbi:MAG: glycosyltransferase [Candidatus Omnitrophica bacterium]|jgi:glycosyltransferase involved in cell wall biosynthesis|nr:glycosyltransferase [Candidatus Omnitrophota bacterium]